VCFCYFRNRFYKKVASEVRYVNPWTEDIFHTSEQTVEVSLHERSIYGKDAFVIFRHIFLVLSRRTQ